MDIYYISIEKLLSRDNIEYNFNLVIPLTY